MLTIQQKAQCVLWYHELKSPTAVQRKFRSEFVEDPPHTSSMKRWFKKFMETGRTLGAKLSIALTYWEQQMEHMLSLSIAWKSKFLKYGYYLNYSKFFNFKI